MCKALGYVHQTLKHGRTYVESNAHFYKIKIDKFSQIQVCMYNIFILEAKG